MNTQQLELANIITLESQSQQKQSQETTGQKSTRKCCSCGIIKPLSEFSKHIRNPLGLDNRCKKCVSSHARQRREAKKNATPKPNHCQLCGEKSNKLFLDHCHKSGEFRGWLCCSCNTGIGMFKDDINLLNLAIKYLTTT